MRAGCFLPVREGAFPYNLSVLTEGEVLDLCNRYAKDPFTLEHVQGILDLRPYEVPHKSPYHLVGLSSLEEAQKTNS